MLRRDKMAWQTEDSEDEFHIRGRRSGGQKLGVKSDAFFSGLGRRDQLFDRGKDSGEFFVVFLLQALDLACDIRVTVHQAAKLDECSHDCDVFTCTARELRRTLESIATPCSV